MHENTLLTPLVIVVGLLFIAALSAIVVKRIHFPYTVGLVLVGIALGFAAADVEFLQPLREVRLTPEFILFLILPTLLFEAAINIHIDILLKNLPGILMLATVGLLISMVIVGISMSSFTPLPLGVALLFGALISATDPVAVIALFKELGVSAKLSTLVEGESLFNDAAAIVTFNIILGIVVTGGSVSSELLVNGVFEFFVVFFGGLAIGVMLSAIVLWIIGLEGSDHLVQIALTSVLAYLAFIVAEHVFHLSGVMAAVGAGVVAAWRADKVFDEQMRYHVRAFWEYAAFVANSLIFLLIGLTEYHLFEDLTHYRENLVYILIAIVVVTIARLLIIYGLTPLGNKMSKAEPISQPERAVMFWGGLKGAIPLALVLGLPHDFEHRVLMLDLTLGVVLFSLLVQGTTIGALLRKLGLLEAKPSSH
jgi:CPA1 family monovalent cation:H+ antiporter